MPDFRDAKVGDRVWSIRHGWGEIAQIYAGSFRVRYDNGATSGMSVMGAEYLSDTNPTVFWNEFPIPDPPKPKRKRVVKAWIFVMRQSGDRTIHYIADQIYIGTDAPIGATVQVRRPGDTLVAGPVPITYEVEE